MADSKQATYEECRKQRMEENKKRMEELNLTNLAQALKPSTPPAKQGKPRARISTEPSSAPLRRSIRMADKPPPNYKEVLFEPLERIRRNYKGRGLLNRVRASDGVRQYAIERADKVESELGSQFPTFIKPMLQSHVSGGFWLGLPHHFCKEHLPLEDEMITLVDEVGDKSQTKYLADKNGLSGGWRSFAIDHDLEDGDALVFQLVNPTQFKVYIIRGGQQSDGNEYDETNDESDEDIDNNPLEKSKRKIRARRSDDNENETSDEEIEYKPSRKNSRKTRARRSDDTENEVSDEDILGKHPGKSTGKTRARRSDDNENEKSDGEIDEKPSRKSSRKTRARKFYDTENETSDEDTQAGQSDDNENGNSEEKDEDTDVATSGRIGKK